MVAIKPLSLSLAVPASANAPSNNNNSNHNSRFNSPLASPTATFVHANNERRTASFGGLGAALKKSTSFKTRPPSDSNLPPRSSGQQGQPRSKSMVPLSRGSTRPNTPSGTSTPSSGSHLQTSLSGLEESYVGKVSMRMLELVNKIFSPNENGSYAGRIVPSWRRSKELGALIDSELRAAEHDPYFFRTMLRSAVLKTLSLFLSRLSAAMSPAPPVTFPVPTPLPGGLQYTLSIVRCAAEVRDCVRACRGLCGDQTLRGWEDKLDDVVFRLMTPVIASIKAQLSSLSVMAHEAGSTTPPPATKSLISRSTHAPPVPVWLKQVHAIFEGTNRILAESGEDGFKWRVQIATVTVWKFSLNLAARDMAATSLTPNATATAGTSKGLAAKAKIKVSTGKKSPSPPASPPLAASASAPSSPPGTCAGHSDAVAKLLQETVAFEAAIKAFVAPLDIALPLPTKDDVVNPKCECALCATGRAFPHADTETMDDDLAKAAMLEALVALSALVVVLTAASDLSLIEHALNAAEVRMTPSDVIAARPTIKPCPTLVAALNALPDLLLAHIVVARSKHATSAAEDTVMRPPHVLFGMEWADYVDELKGFRAAEEWTLEIFDDIGEELDRVVAARQGKETKDEALLRKVLEAARF